MRGRDLFVFDTRGILAASSTLQRGRLSDNVSESKRFVYCAIYLRIRHSETFSLERQLTVDTYLALQKSAPARTSNSSEFVEFSELLHRLELTSLPLGKQFKPIRENTHAPLKAEPPSTEI